MPVGGTPAEAWTSEEGLKDFSSLISTIQINKNIDDESNKGANRVKPTPINDDGLTEQKKKWFDPSYVPKAGVPLIYQAIGKTREWKDLNGIVWYRREIDVPIYDREDRKEYF